MRVRYDTWLDGLNSDWLVSRQRYFGVPFPVWYRVDADGHPTDHDDPLLPPEDALPVDPSTDCPPGFTEAQRDQPGGFTADPDVMDTWATSSLTPQIATGWVDDPDLFARTFPMNLRPRAPRSSAPGSSTPSYAPGSNTARCRGPTRRSTVGYSTPTARRCRSRRATSSPRCRSSRSTAPTRCATGRATAGPESTPWSTSAS